MGTRLFMLASGFSKVSGERWVLRDAEDDTHTPLFIFTLLVTHTSHAVYCSSKTGFEARIAWVQVPFQALVRCDLGWYPYPFMLQFLQL